MRFDEPRLGRHRFEVFENRVEPLDVADLKDAAVLLRELDQFCRLVCVVGHRFFDEHMLALLEQGFGEVEMRRRGRHNVQRVARVDGLGHGAESAHAVFCGDLPRRFSDHVVNAGKLDQRRIRQFRINARVFLAERTDTEHRDFDSEIVCCSSTVVRASHGRSLPLTTDD